MFGGEAYKFGACQDTREFPLRESRFHAPAGFTPELGMRTKPSGILGDWEVPDSGTKSRSSQKSGKVSNLLEM